MIFFSSTRLFSFRTMLAAILMAYSAPVSAAEITIAKHEIIAEQDQPPSGCNIYLQGDIEVGDLEKLRAAYGSVQPAGKYAPSYLCLNSGGGSFSEALRILRWLIDFDAGIATVVNNREQCLSACAVIFMGGSELGHLNRYPRRWLHAGGRLGFHAPYLFPGTLPPRTYSAEEMVNAFAAATKSARELALQFARARTQVDEGPFPGAWVRTSLFLEMLLRAPDDMLVIDTIDRAGRWEIDVFGFRAPKTITREQAKSACRNVVAWGGDRSASELQKSDVRSVYAMDILKQDRTVNASGSTVYQFWTNGRMISYCEFRYKYWPDYRIGDMSVHFNGGGGFGGANRGWMIHPPATKLIDLIGK
jgi:hypothetical protein